MPLFSPDTIRGKIKDTLFPLETSQYSYDLPFPKETKIEKVEFYGPSHTGKFRGAVDFCVPVGTPILAPQDGEVIEIVDTNDKYGGPEFKDYLNYITILLQGEQYQIAHLAKSSVKVREHNLVLRGQPLALSGLSGWMTEPHIHMFVYKFVGPQEKGLKIKFNSESFGPAPDKIN